MQSPDVSFLKATWGSLKNALIGCALAAVFAVVVLGMSLLAANHPRAAEITMQPSPLLATDSGTVLYYLPYPGILPDSVLYPVKALRDKIDLWLTPDQLVRAQKELLDADKRIGAAEVLVQGGKSSLGVSTATKAEKYLEQAVTDAIAVKTTGRDSKSLLGMLEKATAKHMEILDALKSQVNSNDVPVVEKSRMATLLLQEKIRQVLGE